MNKRELRLLLRAKGIKHFTVLEVGCYQGKKTKGDNPNGLSGQDRKQREPFYHIKDNKSAYIKRDLGKANLKMEVKGIVNRVSNPKEPFKHLIF